ncbi:MAG: LLM class flavin-dependent oxidoreductase, partial [Thermodesulfobacteriota bacterium]
PKPGKYANSRWSYTVPEPQDDVGLRVHTKPYQKPHPPIAVAGLTESSGTLKVAGENGWIPMSINFVTDNVLKTHWNSVEEGAQNSGREPDRSKWRIARDVFVADTTQEARELVKQGTLARDFTDYFFKMVPKIRGNLNIFKSDKSMPDSEVTIDYMIDNLWIVGSPDDVAAQIQELYDSVGGFGVLLVMGHEWDPKDKWTRSMKLLSEEVMPRLKF